MDVVRVEDIQDVIVELRGRQVLIDADVANLPVFSLCSLRSFVANNLSPSCS